MKRSASPPDFRALKVNDLLEEAVKLGDGTKSDRAWLGSMARESLEAEAYNRWYRKNPEPCLSR